MTSMKSGFWVWGFGLCALAQAAGASMVVNGGFEKGTDPEPFVKRFVPGVGPGDGDIYGWEVDFGDVDYIGSYWTAAGGERSIDLNGNNLTSPGSISQIVNTTAGEWYRFSFAYSGNPAGGDPLKRFQLSLGEDFTLYVEYDTSIEGNSLADMRWKTLTLLYFATGSETVVQFSSLMGFAWGAAIDSVVMEPIPAPSAGGVLLALAAAGHRRRRR